MQNTLRLVKKNFNNSKFESFYAIEKRWWWFPFWVQITWFYDLKFAQKRFNELVEKRDNKFIAAGTVIHEVLKVK